MTSEFKEGDVVVISDYHYKEFIGQIGTIVHYRNGSSMGIDFGDSFKNPLLWRLEVNGQYFLPKATGRYFGSHNVQKLGPVDVGDLEDDL